MTDSERLARIEQALKRIETLLFVNMKMELITMGDLSNLNASVARETDLVTSVKAMVDGLKQGQVDLQAKLDAAIAAGNDQAAIDAAQAAVDANNATLAAMTAVAAGTAAAT